MFSLLELLPSLQTQARSSTAHPETRYFLPQQANTSKPSCPHPAAPAPSPLKALASLRPMTEEEIHEKRVPRENRGQRHPGLSPSRNEGVGSGDNI